MSVPVSARLLALLSLLQEEREWTGPELADRLGVGPRTIRRDVGKLRGLGYPVEAAPGLAGGYRLGPGAGSPPVVLDDAEAVAVAIGLRTAAAGSIGGVEETSVRALAKLEQLLPERLRSCVRALAASTSAFQVDGSSVDAVMLTMLATACREGTALRFDYISGDGERTSRDTEPHALVHSGRHWYLVAFDRARDDWRTFRVDRLQGSPVAGEAFAPRELPGGDPVAWVARAVSGPGGDPTREPGRVRVDAPAPVVRARIQPRFATVVPDGPDACVVTTTGGWTRHVLVTLAVLDAPLTVLGPPELAAEARAMAARLVVAG